MPTWGGILEEISAAFLEEGDAAYDVVRFSYLSRYAQHVGRDVILYASAWMQGPPEDDHLHLIGDVDMQAMMEVVHGLPGPNLDLILHSPGGSPEITEFVVNYLRQKFTHIRAVIPQAAMSAATMLACACDEIVMGKHSCLGPTDLQVPMATRFGHVFVSTDTILAEFELAQAECADPQKPGARLAWLPILEQYPPGTIQQARYYRELSTTMVSNWLAKWMFGAEADAQGSAGRIAEQLASHGDHKSHNRRLSRNTLSGYGLRIVPLEADEAMQDLALSVYHATTLTFDNKPVAKIIENHQGRVYTTTSATLRAEPA